MKPAFTLIEVIISVIIASIAAMGYLEAYGQSSKIFSLLYDRLSLAALHSTLITEEGETLKPLDILKSRYPLLDDRIKEHFDGITIEKEKEMIANEELSDTQETSGQTTPIVIGLWEYRYKTPDKTMTLYRLIKEP